MSSSRPMCYFRGMEFSDYLIIKAVVLVVAAFVWNFWRAFTGRSPRSGRKEDRSE